jgi:hypothetical protein
MKSLITNIFFISAIFLGSNQLFGQSIQADQKLSIGQEETTFFDDVLNPVTNPTFKAIIYPNPTFLGKVKMTWPDWAEVTTIVMSLIGSDDTKVLHVENLNAVSASELQDGIYVIHFLNQNKVLGVRKLKVIG